MGNMQYTNEDFYCNRCNSDLNEKINFKEKFIHPFDDEPYCDTCCDYLETIWESMKDH